HLHEVRLSGAVDDEEVVRSGSAVGVLAPTGSPLFLDAVDAKVKLEGVDARVEGGRVHLLLVADAE
ncbi:hypothetical protein ACLESO_48015, partial [Pyxidicoccus sp. 3LG]